MLNFSYVDKVTVKIIVFTLIALFAIPYYFYAGGTILGFIVIRLVGSFLNGLAGIGSHRWLCHNSFKPSKFGSRLMLFGMILSGYGKPLHIVIAHRLHHIHTDTELDPHSPKNLSFLKLWLGRYTKNSNIIIPKDFFRNKEAVFVNNHYWKLYILFNVIFMLIDFKSALIFCPVTLAYGWTLNTIINYYGHKNGNNIEPHNLNWYLSFITYGEGLHKNHHDNQSYYDFSSGNRFDIGAVLIRRLLISR